MYLGTIAIRSRIITYLQNLPLRFSSMSLYGFITQTLTDTNMVPKPYRIRDIRSIRVLQCVWKPKKPKQCDCLTGSGYLPPSSHPGDPKPHGEHRCFPIQLSGPPFPNGPGSPYPRPAGGTRRRPEVSRRERSRMSSPFIFPYPVENNSTGLFCISEESSAVLLPRERDVTLRRLRKQQLHYRGGVIWLQSPLLYCESDIVNQTTAWQHHYSLCSLKITWKWPLFNVLAKCVLSYARFFSQNNLDKNTIENIKSNTNLNIT